MNISPLFLILFRIIACHPVKQFSGQTAVSVIASGEPISGSAGLDFYCDFGKLRCTVVGNDDPSFGIYSVITIFSFAHINFLSFRGRAVSDFLLLLLCRCCDLHRLDVLSGGIDVGLDFPEYLRICPDCLELGIGRVMLPFQFCIF